MSGRCLRLVNGRFRRKGNTPWKWFMDKATILKKKYSKEIDNGKSQKESKEL